MSEPLPTTFPSVTRPPLGRRARQRADTRERLFEAALAEFRGSGDRTTGPLLRELPDELREHLEALSEMDAAALIEDRYAKFRQIGRFAAAL